jgi:hypothetical protein
MHLARAAFANSSLTSVAPSWAAAALGRISRVHGCELETREAAVEHAHEDKFQ